MPPWSCLDVINQAGMPHALCCCLFRIKERVIVLTLPIFPAPEKPRGTLRTRKKTESRLVGEIARRPRLRGQSSGVCEIADIAPVDVGLRKVSRTIFVRYVTRAFNFITFVW